MKRFRYGYSLFQKIIEAYYSMGIKTENSYVFMFHHASNENLDESEKNFWISEVHFEQFIKELQTKGYIFCKASELPDYVDKRFVCLTFDDVPSDSINAMQRILDKIKISYTVFIADSLIDQEGFIKTKDIQRLASNPLCEIGFHTKSHLLLRFMDKSGVETELVSDKLQSLLDKPIDTIAFPYGSVYACGKREYSLAVQKGYQAIFSTISAPITVRWIKKYKNIYPRINVNDSNYRQILDRIPITDKCENKNFGEGQ